MRMDAQPWFHETPGPQWFNEWSWTHAVWGLIVARWNFSAGQALLAHTVYEMIEGQIFPHEHRDISMRNHFGDTIIFMWGHSLKGKYARQ